MRTFLITAAAALAMSLPSPSARAHGGGLNADGCHTNRQTGDYHCHRAPAPKASAPARQSLASEEAQDSATVRYANCSEVRAAGKAPPRRGDPGYAAHLDRDNDGVACEPPPPA